MAEKSIETTVGVCALDGAYGLLLKLRLNWGGFGRGKEKMSVAYTLQDAKKLRCDIDKVIKILEG